MAYERKCQLCGDEYKYCPRCGEFDHLPKWMTIFDKEECREIFWALSDYSAKNKTAEDVMIIFNKYPSADHSKYTENVRNTIKEIKNSCRKMRKKTAVAAAEREPEPVPELVEVIE